MSYYYLIASLPALAMEQTPISEEAFHTRCQAELRPRDMQAVYAAEATPDPDLATSQSFVRRWNDHEIQLRNTIAQTRAAKRQIDASRIMRTHGGYTTIIEDAVETAWNQPTPLDREKALDKLRWKLLEDIQGPDPFSFNVILAYALKRKIAQRWAVMDETTGWEKARTAFEQEPAGTNRQHEPETAGIESGTQN
ncbi:MAG: DUF2764 family protein [Kiritimatiellia bacterium]